MTDIRIMTFNVRGAPPEDGVNIWQNRSALNVETIRACAPDVIGFQEVQIDNLETFKAQLGDYAFEIGLVSNRSDKFLFNAIFWNPQVLACESADGCYLSRTPDRWSKDWDSGRVRVANWVKLHIIDTELEFMHVNTHLDHISEQARIEGSRVIMEQLAKTRSDNIPIFVTGDFNCAPESSPYCIFQEHGFVDAYQAAQVKDSSRANTFHGFQGDQFSVNGHAAQWRIDWILALSGMRTVTTKAYAVVRKAAPPIYPSDHYPVIADFEIDSK